MMFPDPSNDQQRTALRLAAERAAAARNTQTGFEQRIESTSEQITRRSGFDDFAQPGSRLQQQR